MIDLHERPEIAAAICQHVEEYYRQRALRVLDAAGGRIDIIGSGGDIGGERGMILSPRIWRRKNQALLRPADHDLQTDGTEDLLPFLRLDRTGDRGFSSN